MRAFHSSEKKITKSQDGINLYYETDYKHGKKNVLFFVHGLGGDLEAWDKERSIMQGLGYSTIAVDLRGHGYSGHPKEENYYTMDNFANDILEIMKNEKLEHFTLVGHCFGGMVSMAAAVKEPPGLTSLILIDTTYKVPYLSNILTESTVLNKFISLISKYSPKRFKPIHIDYTKIKFVKDYDWKMIFLTMMHNSLRSYLSSAKEMFAFNGETLLKKVKVPTLVVVGEKDSIFPPGISKSLSERIRSSIMDVIPGGNHVVVLNNPKELSASIQKFLEQLFPSKK